MGEIAESITVTPKASGNSQGIIGSGMCEARSATGAGSDELTDAADGRSTEKLL
jgi:hypothetical protein